MRKPLTILMFLLVPVTALAQGAPAPSLAPRAPPQLWAPHPNDFRLTKLRILPPEAGAVFLFDGTTLLGRFDAPGQIVVTSGRTYGVVAMRGPRVLFRELVGASGGTVDMLWGNDAAPIVRQLGIVLPEPIVIPPPPPLATGPQGPPPLVGPPPPAPPPAQPAAPQRPPVMANASFDALVQQVKDESFESTRLEIVKSAATRNYFNVAQIGRLLECFDFESNRVDVCTSLRSRVVDPENGFTLVKHFTFSSSKQQIAALFSH